jgi:hypothetical protein
VEKKLASTIIRSTRSLNEKLGEIDLAISEMPNGMEKDKYIKALGNVIGTLSRNIVFPIVQEYPDLDPYERK